MNIQIGQYMPGKTLIHRLDPRTKILALIILMSAIFTKSSSINFVIMSGFLYFCFLFSNISVSVFWSTIKPLWFMLIFLLIINIFVVKTGDIIYTLPYFNRPVYSDAVYNTFHIFWRILLVISLSIILTTTTDPLKLTLGLEKLASPLKKVNVPVSVFAMMISIALRFIPTILEEVTKIANAQASRGLDLENGNFKTKIKAIIALVIPLLMSSFTKADELALSMEAKNYNPMVERPRYRTITMRAIDYVVLMLCIAYLVLMILARLKIISIFGI